MPKTRSGQSSLTSNLFEAISICKPATDSFGIDINKTKQVSNDLSFVSFKLAALSAHSGGRLH
jgi:hypothetical protein